jgi:polysaccharide export outer membrane protein
MLKNSLIAGLMILSLAGPRLLAQGHSLQQAYELSASQGGKPTAQSPASTAAPISDLPLTARLATPANDTVPVAQAVAAEPAAAGVALRNGDTVEVRIANVPPEDVGQIDGTYTLDESGMLNLPFIGLIKAGGLPPSQVQIAIQNKYVADGIYTNPTVTVNPPAQSRFVDVSGAVRSPGRVPYSSDLTLMTTIDSAGGPSDFAGDQIRLVRGGKIQYFSRKKLNKDPSLDPRIEPGDQIQIKESWW